MSSTCFLIKQIKQSLNNVLLLGLHKAVFSIIMGKKYLLTVAIATNRIKTNFKS